MTTIKLDADLRNRLDAEARSRGVTAGSFVEELFELWQREQRFAAIRRAMAAASADELASYQAEVAELDTLTDDLPDDAAPRW
jgi:predicted transcriptional regulator